MRRQLVRRTSKSARFAQGAGFFALLLFVLAAVAFRGGVLDALSFVLVLGVAALTACIAFAFGTLGLWRLWSEGAVAGGASLRGMVMAAIAMAPVAVGTLLLALTPPISDITTDLNDPPEFPLGARVDLPPPVLPAAAPDIRARLQLEAYPDLATRRIAADDATMARAIEAAAKSLGWKPTTKGGSLDSPTGLLWAYETHSAVFGFIDDVVLRQRREGDMIAIDLRSASRFGHADMGANARRIRSFEGALNEALRGKKR
jgi:Protein of unknown function (DUF1499)